MNSIFDLKSLNKLVISSFLIIILSVNSNAFAQTTPDISTTPAILPDNPFYGLKTAFEDLQTALTFNDTQKAQFEVKLAQERLAEIQAELQKGDHVSVQKAQDRHDKEVDDVEKLADKQNNDNHGQQVKTYVHQLLADHDKNIGELVSVFASSGNNDENKTISVLHNLKAMTSSIRQSHGDNEQVNPSVKADRRD